jgi:hypothetical protein
LRLCHTACVECSAANEPPVYNERDSPLRCAARGLSGTDIDLDDHWLTGCDGLGTQDGWTRYRPAAAGSKVILPSRSTLKGVLNTPFECPGNVTVGRNQHCDQFAWRLCR